jgi:hypothetical protein
MRRLQCGLRRQYGWHSLCILSALCVRVARVCCAPAVRRTPTVECEGGMPAAQIRGTASHDDDSNVEHSYA